MRDSLRRRLPQILRRLTQLGVLLFIAYTASGGMWRNFKLAHNSRRLVGLIAGDVWATLYGLNEDLLALLGDPYRVSFDFLGMPWASSFFGLDSVDPILATTISLTHGPSLTLLSGLILPLLLAALLGKVFCSHLCPARLAFEWGQAVRRGLERLGLAFPRATLETRLGGWILLGGVLASLSTGAGVWFLILPYTAISGSIFLSISAGAGGGLFAIAMAFMLADALVGPGVYCHNLCPTGWVLEQVGRLSLLKVRKTDDTPCPDLCYTCIRACPFLLSPKMDTHTPACNQCGICVPLCPEQKLVRTLRLPSRTSASSLSRAAGLLATLGMLVLTAAPGLTLAHHNKGLPHYGYFENYPQVPTQGYMTIEGKYEMGATVFNFQGLERESADTPNDVKIYTYIYDLKTDKNYKGPATFEIRLDGTLVSRFQREAVDEEAVYSTRETLPESGIYELVAFLGDDTSPVATLPFEIDLAQDALNWPLIIAFILPGIFLFGLAWKGRSKKRLPKLKEGGPSAMIWALALASVSIGGLAHPSWAMAGGGAITGSQEEAGSSVGVEDQVRSGLGVEIVAGDREDGAAAGLASGLLLARADAQPAAASDGTPQDVICPVCGMINCTMQHFDTADGGKVMVMGGIPLWLFLVGIGGILLISFIAVEWHPIPTGGGFRRNLIKNRRIYLWVRSRWFQAIPQLVMVGLLVLLIYAGFFGSRLTNITPVAVWTIWWAGLIFAVALLGPTFCFACPWDGATNLITRLRLAARVPSLSLEKKVPSWLQNMYPAIALFTILTWLELGFGVTTNPRTTAFMGLAMVVLAITMALLFEGKAFCKHMCPVGRISGIYANFSPVEIRARNPRTCQKCVTEDCLNGNEHGYPCPTGISLKTVTDSTYCTQCTECVKSCNKYNVAFNLRPPASDLHQIRHPRADEAWMALILLALTLFHGLSMTPTWENFQPGSSSILKWMALTFGTPKAINFTVAMAVVMAIPIVLYGLSCMVASVWTRASAGNWKALFRQYSFSLLPVALFYHLAHNAMHMLMEGGEVVPLLGDPLGSGANYLGLADLHPGSLIGENALWYLQVGLILTGHIFGIVVAHRIGHRLYSDKKMVLRSLVPMLVVMILLSVAGLSLMHLDMNMRVGRM